MLLAYFKQTSGGLSGAGGIAYANNYEGAAGQSDTAVSDPSPIDSDAIRVFNTEAPSATVDNSYLVNANNPLSNILPMRGGLVTYKVQKGDNLARIAANFGISVNTILWANKDLKNKALRVGQELTLLPVNGVLHQIQSGETLDLIAQEYSVDAQKILYLNTQLSIDRLDVGSTIIIPDGKPLEGVSYFSSYNLPDLPGFFAIPTTGWNWGRLHGYNGVDIANVCGTPVYSSAEGLVIDESSSSWNGGYGRYIMIEHTNGTKTRYAHLEKIMVSIGDYISKGDVIGYMGNTGKTDGPTGCHLHFEIMGAKNPFAR